MLGLDCLLSRTSWRRMAPVFGSELDTAEPDLNAIVN
jgi:hypothetical protein